jgi:hypothetical protein
VQTSDETGRLYTMTHPDCVDSITKIVDDAKGRFQWIWTHDLQAELLRAEERMLGEWT